jgi:hypothetical protein
MICLATWHVQNLFRVDVGKELVMELKKYKTLIKLKGECPSTEKK